MIKRTIKGRFPKLIIRYRIYRKAGLGTIFLNFIFKKFRKNKNYSFSLHYTSQVINPDQISLAHDVTTLVSFAVSGGCYFQANNGIVIGRNCLLAPGVKLISSNHNFQNYKIINDEPIILGNNVWVGANVVILPGVKVADHVSIGAGSVVTRSIKQSHVVVAGVPARIIKVLDEA